MRSLQYLQLRHAIRKQVNRQIKKHKALSDFLNEYQRDRQLRAALVLGYDRACAPPKDSVDLARGFRYVLRNEVGQPITRITLQRDPKKDPDVIWRREEDDDAHPELVLARAYCTKYGDPRRYVTA